jgi:serine-type D-Ala-D-Ala carboxypeptidase/endopeptidase (penicillin-binding protein 4)
MVAVLLLVGPYFGVGQTRQFAANRSFHPLVIPTASSAPADTQQALAALAASPPPASSPAAGSPATAAGVTATLTGPLSAAALGPSVAAQVYDAASGAALYQRRAGELVAPASTAKLLTAAALLRVHHATDRFSTNVVQGAQPGTVVLVGGGDPTLSAAPAGQDTEYAGAARISDLAVQVKKKLAGQRVSTVLVDSSLFTGPTTAAGWASNDAPSSYASPITATMVDAGRDSPGASQRSGTPDLAAGQALATALGSATVARGTAPAGAKVLATVRSAPVDGLIEQMLRESDNVIAEVLARQVAIAAKLPASFDGGAAAIAGSLNAVGITVGSGMKDGSGLSALDRIPAVSLGQVLVAATGPQHPELRPMIAGLSVAGWDGTLVEQNRFSGDTSNAAGLVRAKTGSLTGVSSIAGVVTDSDGQLLVFSMVADKVPSADPTPSRNALDSAVDALVNCGCH